MPIQNPPKTTNYFELLEHSINFEVDIKKLSKNHRKLQVLYHPDKFSTKSKEEQEISENWSALINEAYSTLINPMKRALYLLEYYGDPLLEKDQPKLDNEFLMEIMELNEEVDGIDTQEDIKTLKESINDKINDLHESLMKKFENKDISQAKIIVAKMQYFHNVKNQLKEKEYL